MKIPQASTQTFAAPGVLLLVLTAGTAFAQQPSQDQINAVRQSCRSDFMANCSGVTPGSKDALECLKQNLAKLSGSCKTAVSAIVPPPAVGAPIRAAFLIGLYPARGRFVFVLDIDRILSDGELAALGDSLTEAPAARAALEERAS